LPLFRIFVLSAALAVAAAGASAQTKLVDELRLGAFRHDAGVFGTHKEAGVDLNGELRFVSPDILKAIWAPRPHVGVSVNTIGNTSQAYAGLTWTFTLAHGLFGANDRLFLDASLGGAVHDGNLNNSPDDQKHKELGSRVLFRESLELGWAFIPGQSISIFLDHVSNANLSSSNEGLDNLGLRYGIKF
jgi:lipid A 3-O-deacylase